MAQRKLILLGEHTVKRKVGDADSAPIKVNVLSLMLPSTVAKLGFDSKEASGDLGKEITAKNSNGTYKSEVKGTLGQQPITVILDEQTEAKNQKTVRFQVPYWFPNYKVRKLLEDVPGVIGYRRNGSVYRIKQSD